MKRFTPFLILLAVVLSIVIVIACSKEEDSVYVTPHAHTVNDLAGYTVATVSGSTQSLLFDSIKVKVVSKHYRTANDVMVAVETRLADFGVFDSLMLIGYDCARHNIQQSFVMRSKNLCNDIALMFDKENTALRDEYNTFFEELKRSNVYQSMMERWLTDDVYNTKIPTSQSVASTDTLNVAVWGESPFSFIDEKGVWQGLEIELTSRFATYLDRPVKYVDCALNNAFDLLKDGIVDIVAMQIFVTNEREKDFCFSTPYYRCPTVVVERIN